MAIEDLAGTVIRELHNAIKTHTVVGDPIDVGGRKIIPLTKVSFGFGVGSGTGKDKKKGKESGGGSGAGASIEPIGFLEVTADETRLIPAHEKKEIWEKILTSPQAKKIFNKLWSKISLKVDGESACQEKKKSCTAEAEAKKGISKEEADALFSGDPRDGDSSD